MDQINYYLSHVATPRFMFTHAQLKQWGGNKAA